jgi:hypothetical protein
MLLPTSHRVSGITETITLTNGTERIAFTTKPRTRFVQGCGAR